MPYFFYGLTFHFTKSSFESLFIIIQKDLVIRLRNSSDPIGFTLKITELLTWHPFYLSNFKCWDPSCLFLPLIKDFILSVTLQDLTLLPLFYLLLLAIYYFLYIFSIINFTMSSSLYPSAKLHPANNFHKKFINAFFSS